MENAARIFSTQELERRKLGGFYSTIGRSKVGLIETDIDDLTATTTSRAEVLAAGQRKDVARSLASHSDGILAGLLSPQAPAPLPTVRPACLHEPLRAHTGTAGKDGVVYRRVVESPKRSRFGRSSDLQHDRRSESDRPDTSTAATTAAAQYEEGRETSERLRILGANETQHRKNMGNNLRRLRMLLGKSNDNDETQQSGSPSVFSVHELRTIEAVRRGQQLPNGNSAGAADVSAGDNGADEDSLEEQGGGQQRPTTEVIAHKQGPVAELAEGGNHLLRKLAKAMFSSMQSRIQKELLSLGFLKWKVRPLVCCRPTDLELMKRSCGKDTA